MRKILMTFAVLFAASSAQAWEAYGPVYVDAIIPVPVWGDETTDLSDCDGVSEYTVTGKRGYGVWNQVSGSKFRWSIGGWNGPFGSGGDGYNSIRFKEIPDGGVLGQTSYMMYGPGNAYRDADMQIDLNQNWACGPANPSWRQIDLQSVICHEAGHKLGLGHSSYSGATMFWAIGQGENKRVLHFDDQNGVKALYPN